MNYLILQEPVGLTRRVYVDISQLMWASKYCPFWNRKLKTIYELSDEL